MTWVVLTSLMERRTRAALTALAVVLGVAMIAGSLILTDTIDRAFTNIFGSSYTNTDLVVRGKPVVDESFAGAPPVPAALLGEIRALPGVADAAGSLVDLSGSGDNVAKLIDRNGAVIAGSMPTFGFGVDASRPRFNPLKLAGGTWARGPHQVVIDAATAKAHGYAVGDQIGVLADGPVRTFRISGLARFGNVDSLGGATIAVFDIPTARTVLGMTGFEAIQIAAAPGVTQAELARQVAPLLPTDLQATTGEHQAARDKRGIDQAITFIRALLLAFGGIALVVGAFVIFNTLSITVAQRTRELATLRTLGASRRQVMRSVIAEAGIVGAVASLAGLGLGVLLAKGLFAFFRAAGLDMPQGDTVFAARTAVVALVAGTGVTLVAGVLPAIRATRVPPIAAVRDGAELPESAVARRAPIVAGVALAAAGAMLARGLSAGGLGTGDRMLMLGGGTLALFAGVAVVAPRLVRPLAAVVGWPVSRRGAEGALAADNAVRNPARTASTAAALMIGLALVAFVAVLGTSLIGTGRGDVRDQLSASHVVTASDGFGPLTTSAGRHLSAALPGAVVSAVREDHARVAGESVALDGVDPSTIARTYRFAWSAGGTGSLAALGRDGAVVSRVFAEDHDLSVGSRIPLTGPTGGRGAFRVVGVYDPPRLAPVLAPVIVSQAAFDSVVPRPRDRFALVADVPGGTAAIQRALSAFPDTKVHTAAAYARVATDDLTTILNMLYVLLGLSVIISVFGMVNTMVLAVHERTRELGMLRAVGMTRRQVRRMVRGESVITALIGAALGIPLGVGLAAMAVRALSDWGVGLAVPVSLAWFVVVAVAVGVVAAVMPARRAARLDVLRALQYE